jgi:hypothetical protein
MIAPLQIAFLTGQSDPHGCALSQLQQAFLNNLALPSAKIVPRNFPYRASRPHRVVPLWLASLHNGWQFLAPSRSQRTARARKEVIHLIEGATRTVFLAGSCGLEIFNKLQLPKEVEERCSLLAYGPVARRRPRHSKCILIQGRHDWISRCWFGTTDYTIEGAHLDYLRSPQFMTIAQKAVQYELALLLCNNTSLSEALPATSRA